MTHQNLENELYLCGRCKQHLPLTAFYKTKKRGRDNYCRRCRHELSQSAYDRWVMAQSSRKRDYPVITEIQDAQLRLRLIKNALRVVKDSMHRRQQRIAEMEYNNQ